MLDNPFYDEVRKAAAQESFRLSSDSSDLAESMEDVEPEDIEEAAQDASDDVIKQILWHLSHDDSLLDTFRHLIELSHTFQQKDIECMNTDSVESAKSMVYSEAHMAALDEANKIKYVLMERL